MSPKPLFFSPKGRLSVSRPLATIMNTLNILAPTLLLCALILAGMARFGDYDNQINNLLMQTAAFTVVAALAIRIIWGITIRFIRKRSST